MRVISGSLKGRRLAPVQGDIRPTSDKLRESLFNVVGGSVRGSVWIDLFAGSGAVGIEALSRGASFVVFNDRSRTSLRLIEKNLKLCGLDEGLRVLSLDAFKLLGKPEPVVEADFVFVDPPYDFHRYDRLVERVLVSPALAPGGTLILEVFRKSGFDPVRSGAELVRTLRVGDSLIHFLRSEGSRPQARAAR